MAPKPLSLLFVLSVLVASFSYEASAGGEYQRIIDLKDPHVVHIGEFAVTEHNNQNKTTLEFVEIVKGEKQVVAGFNYKLLIAAKDGATSMPNNYEAVIFEDLQSVLKLKSFKIVST
ncbi:hypothetical protein BUALT_Bualt13G0101900 [Buddleja alternifolia]|uniref:Cystatin domain-containing protein n=1 Tax=Buddleja alternifolia TaxID=168488 RepID=A0AAV6WTK9_9LAMI|nr:hypothetical protein BUALT_Bualt13G0101900 [Buddleja alternifolia]